MNILYLRRTLFKHIKQIKVVFIIHEWITGYRDILEQKKVNHISDKKTQKEISHDKKIIKKYSRCGLFHYYRYGLQFKKLNDEELLNYVPTYYHHKSIERNHSNIDTIKYGDKLVQAHLFKERNIPSPNLIGIYKKGKCIDLNNNPILLEDIINSYLINKENKLFFKPINGNGGSGIFVLKYKDGIYYLNGKKFNIENIVEVLIKKETYIIQENIIQTNQMMNINPSSVNTLRVVVQNDNNKMKIKSCIIRMGRSGKEVDNSAQGGVSVKVNIEDGVVAEFATAEHGGYLIYEHPDSKKKFKGIVIENWDEIKNGIEIIANKLIDFNDIALDIALTDNGPILIEYNFRYGIEHQQCVLGGVRKILNISNY